MRFQNKSIDLFTIKLKKQYHQFTYLNKKIKYVSQ